jgi:serine/threonine-protein kinase
MPVAPMPVTTPTISAPNMAPGIAPMMPAMTPTSSAPLPSLSGATIGMRPQSAPGAASRPAAVDDPDMFIGQELCGYLIRRKLAEGGMGVVYEGVHGRIGRLGAIKVLKLEFCRSEAVVERFYQEARAVNAIRHENIVDVYDFGRDPYGRVFFVMEYLDGEPLSARLRRGVLPWTEAFPIVEQILRALKAAHDKGFIHRDLKPDNIWLKYVDGRVQVKLLDFGIAKLVGADSPGENLTQTGLVIGTPHYMSPEQINGSKAIDHRADIYALGVMLYEMFAGVTPFGGDTLQAVMTGHLFQDPPRLADISPSLGVPPPIAELVDRMLVKDAAGRYDSAADVLSDLHDVNRNRWPTNAETLKRTRPTRVLPPIQPPAPQPVAPPRRTGKRAGVFIGAAVAVAAIAGVAVWESRQQPPAAVDTPVAQGSGHAGDHGPTPPPPQPPQPPQPTDEELRGTAQSTLRGSLREAEPAVRVQGSDALGKIKDQPSVPALTELTERDPDPEARGHAADALGVIGASATASLLGKLEAAAPPPLKVWYASALARLGDKGAAKRLLGYARSKDLAVSFKAGLTLGDVSPPGDKQAIAALKAIAAHEAELNDLQPYAGALILTRLSALHDASSRKLLYSILEHPDEGARLAAAEGLARLGDDAGRKVLHDVFADPASPNRLVAAVAQIPLGDYDGLDLITARLGDKDPGIRRLVARALGDMAERKSLARLIPLASDKEWTVRIAASAAIVAIVGLDPAVLAQASVDWTRSALDSQDLAVRKAAAGVLADIPEKQAVPLLAHAIADPDPNVRLAASRSAGKMKGADAVAKVTDAVKTETNAEVKEQQVKALGEIGRSEAHDTLAQIAEEPGRIGVLAAGSLIAVGDAAGKAKLDVAVAAPQPELRLAAMEAASSARNPIVVPTLMVGVADHVFGVRFVAALGLAAFNAEKAAAIPVLTAALESKDAGVVGRAFAAMTQLGEKITNLSRTPAEMLDSTDPKQRLAAVPAVRAMAPAEGVPLLRRLVADPDQDVRRAGVDAIEDVIAKDKDQAIKLYKPLVSDTDAVVRSKASGQLSRLVPPPPPPPPATPSGPITAGGSTVTPPDAAPAGPDPAVMASVKAAVDDTRAASGEAQKATEALETGVSELTQVIAVRAPDETALAHVKDLEKTFKDAPAQLEAVVAKVEAAAKATAAAAGVSPPPELAKLVDEANALAAAARASATAGRDKATASAQAAAKFIKDQTSDIQMLIAAAEAEIAGGAFTEAQKNLDSAAKRVREAGSKNANLDYLYAQLHDKMSVRTQDPAARRKLLQQAADSYRRFATTGTGPRVQRASERAAEIADEIKDLGPP